MKQLRFFTMFFLIFAWGVVIATGPASAALYQDNFTATITSVGVGGLGAFNPYGLSNGQSFGWSIVYDTATVQPSGFIGFNGFFPTNQISIAIPRSGNTPQIFTKTMDDNYGTGKFDDPSGNYAGGKLTDLTYYSSLILTLPYSGYLTVDFITGGSPALYFDPPSGTNIYSAFFFNPGISTFDPITDRQVVPIPGALVLLSSGLAALAILRRKQG